MLLKITNFVQTMNGVFTKQIRKPKSTKVITVIVDVNYSFGTCFIEIEIYFVLKTL